MFCALTLHPQNVDASPRDLNCLKDTAGGDIRTLDKLYDNVNSTYDDSHMWLTVFDGKRNGNTVYVFFDTPVCVSKVVFWNYSKTPSRGVKEFEMLVDDVLVFRGELSRAPEDDGSGNDFGQSVLFTNDEQVVQEETSRGRIKMGGDDGGMMLFMDGEEFDLKEELDKGGSGGGDGKGLVRPSTSVSGGRRKGK